MFILCNKVLVIGTYDLTDPVSRSYCFCFMAFRKN